MRKDEQDGSVFRQRGGDGTDAESAGLSWRLAQNDYMIVGRHKIAPGQAHPPNSHDNEEECFYVLAGKGLAIVGKARYPSWRDRSSMSPETPPIP